MTALRCAALRCHDGGELSLCCKAFLIMESMESSYFICWYIFSSAEEKLLGPYHFSGALKKLEDLPKNRRYRLISEYDVLCWGLLEFPEQE